MSGTKHGQEGSEHLHGESSHHAQHPTPVSQQAPVLPFSGGASAYGEIDSSAPVVSDWIYGDTFPSSAPSMHMTRSGSRVSRSSRNRNRKSSRASESRETEPLLAASAIGQAEENDDDDYGSVKDEDDHLTWLQDRPWYKRPDERWLRPFVLLLAVGSGMIMGPRVEIGMQLVCEEILGVQSLASTTPHERPPLSDDCRIPEVEAGYTAFALKIALAMGVLSAITTGFWGGVSDRRGRVLALRLTTLSLAIGDLTYIILGLFPQSVVPLGKNLLVAGAAVEGLLGGFATLTAAHLAYIADVTPNGTRATVFSFFTGMFFFGFVLGPSLGGYLAKHMHSTMAPFYFALLAHITYFIFAAIFLPESSDPDRMQNAQDEHRRSKAAFADEQAQTKFLHGKARVVTSYVVTPFRPLALLLPTRRPSQDHPDVHVAEANASHISVSRVQKDKLDWNLTVIAIAYFLEASTLGVLTPKITYAMNKFGWGVEEVGYFLSFTSLARVACLTIIIPLFVKSVHKPVQKTALPQDGQSVVQESGDERSATAAFLDNDGRPRLVEGRQMQSTNYGAVSEVNVKQSIDPSDVVANVEIEDSDSAESDTGFRLDARSRKVERLWTMRARHLRQIHDSRFDRRLTLGSLAIAAFSYLMLALTSGAEGSGPFVALSAFVSLGGGASAALSSLALAMLPSDRDAGKFFAAWSILSALSQTILGPIVFSAVFVKTVKFAPESIFLLGFALFVLAGVAVVMVRVRSTKTLPPLPPRPHTPASLRASKKSSTKSDGVSGNTTNDETLGPYQSSASRLRMRAANPFKSSQQTQRPESVQSAQP